MQQQLHHLPARSRVSTFWKVRFCEPGRFLKLPHPSLAVPSAENVTILFGSWLCGARNAFVPGSRGRTPPVASGQRRKKQHVLHVSIMSGPCGTTVIDLQIRCQILPSTHPGAE